MKQKIPVAELTPGMYVCELDRPWLDTPFAFQGFLIESHEQIEELRRHCNYVFIDPMLSTDIAPTTRHATPRSAHQPAQEIRQEARPYTATSHRPRNHNRKPIFGTFRGGQVLYKTEHSVEQALPEAKQAHHEYQSTVRNVAADIRSGKILDAAQVKMAVSSMVESIIQNPDALIWLTRLKDKDSYSYGHAVDVSIYMLAFGRHLGFPRDQLERIGVGALLLDVGKLKLPQDLLEKRGKLDPAEHALIKTHVLYTMEILGKTPDMPPEAIEMAARHHERLDGHGYPRGLAGEDIGIFGSMAGIVDCFDALTSYRPYANPTSPFEALQMLYGWRGVHFHEALVEQFIQCLGVFPAGSLVELNTGEVAIVIEQSRIRRLKPRVMVILDSEKKPYTHPRMLDLLHAPKAFHEEPYAIARALEPGMYAIDPKEYFL